MDLTFISSPEVPAEEDVLDAYSQAVIAVAERLSPSVANLRVSRRVRGGRRLDGGGSGVEVVGTDPLSDLAVLRAEGSGFTPAVLGDAENLRVGQLVVAIGNPHGF